jgi:hypothetical protein
MLCPGNFVTVCAKPRFNHQAWGFIVIAEKNAWIRRLHKAISTSYKVLVKVVVLEMWRRRKQQRLSAICLRRLAAFPPACSALII